MNNTSSGQPTIRERTHLNMSLHNTRTNQTKKDPQFTLILFSFLFSAFFLNTLNICQRESLASLLFSV